MNAQLPATIHQHPAAVKRFTEDQVNLIKRTICKGASDDELEMFMYQCARTGLDPFARQIYSVERKENRDGNWVTVRSIQTSIDGFRLIAERSQKYAGQLGPFWCGQDGVWQDVWLDSSAPVAARVGVLRHDFKEPCWGVARFGAYAQRKRDGSPTLMWSKMADVMIAKCAEALALRKAFPQELSGLYTDDELRQSEVVEAEILDERDDRPQPKISPAQAAELTIKLDAAKEKGADEDQFWLFVNGGGPITIKKVEDVTVDRLPTIISALKSRYGV